MALRIPQTCAALRRKTEKRRNRRLRALSTVNDDALFERLRLLRKRLADDQDVPPYVFFSDATLRELRTHQPATLQAFRQIGGVGDVPKRYGTAYVGAICSSDTATPQVSVPLGRGPNDAGIAVVTLCRRRVHDSETRCVSSSSSMSAILEDFAARWRRRTEELLGRAEVLPSIFPL
jgi:ribonuclease D